MGTTPFGDVLDRASALSLEEQEMLIEVLRKRRAEAWRKELAADIAQARRDLAAGRLKIESHEKMKRRLRKSLRLHTE
ncbi:MAG: hypothetical protein HY735_13300 [Verrucomicrobia bacterium]|nr:hypothetical protein [Verrucomicrobiota bacterium]